MTKHTASLKPFCLTDDFQVTVPSCSSVRSPWIRSSLRNSLPSFSRPTDFGSRRRLISLSRAAFSYSLTRSFTWEMASLISSRACTRDLCSSVSAARRHRGRDIVNQHEREPNRLKSALKQLDIQSDHDVFLPSVFCMILSTRMGYFVMRWVTKRKHSGIPNLRTSGSWPIFCHAKSSWFRFFYFCQSPLCTIYMIRR